MKKSFVILNLVCLLAGCSNKTGSDYNVDHPGTLQVQTIKYRVIKTYPHNTESYTEGLLFHDSQLFESTGFSDPFPYTRTVFGPVDMRTGKIDVKVELDKKKFFGEGIVYLKDKIYQLTYTTQVGFIYDSKTYEEIGSFKFSNKEGWGLTTDGHNLIMSDGTNILTFLDPDSLKPFKTIKVSFNGSPMMYLNELEYINAYIYANVYTSSKIVKIDPKTGIIKGMLDLKPLLDDARMKFPLSEVTNGIAYDSSNDRIFVTGKFWPTIYQISFTH
jgi:glutaminyl-peptide cyclotransferase